ncbi:DUF4238 domain-containing protein [Pseudomonas caspiana]|uniref:DUF4238 domain-containing protein n=1 Tax=Pseudomonas caspiana TaxID=1451454 RepID=UPI0032EF0F46
MSDPKKHHYVPKGVLKNFTFDKHKKKINFIDKYSGLSLSSSIAKVASERYLYRFSDGGVCLEKSYFGEIDDSGASVIDKIICDSSINNLTLKEQRDLRRFVSAQMLRVPAVLKQLENFEEDISSAFDGEHSVIKETAHTDFLKSILKGVELYEALLAKKHMIVLVQRKSSECFVIGDVPVVQRNYGADSTSQVGHSLPIIDWDFVALPISPKYLLVYFNQACQVDIRQFALENNDWQFIQADKFVYSESKERLSFALKIYHQNSYRYIESVRPDYIERYSIKYGDKVEIGSPRLAFTDVARKQLRDLFSRVSKSK